eukprot:2365499-Pyramimonas_sp.AAC.1
MSLDLSIYEHCPGISPEEHAAIRAAYSTLFRSGACKARPACHGNNPMVPPHAHLQACPTECLAFT